MEFALQLSTGPEGMASASSMQCLQLGLHTPGRQVHVKSRPAFARSSEAPCIALVVVVFDVFILLKFWLLRELLLARVL